MKKMCLALLFRWNVELVFEILDLALKRTVRPQGMVYFFDCIHNSCMVLFAKLVADCGETRFGYMFSAKVHRDMTGADDGLSSLAPAKVSYFESKVTSDGFLDSINR